MTPEQQRIAIAEACGWTDIVDSPARLHIVGCRHKEKHLGLVPIPDYPSDLNAMHEAEKYRWIGDLKRLHTNTIVYNAWNLYRANLKHNVHATAAHRAEAFLKTIGKWTDE